MSKSQHPDSEEFQWYVRHGLRLSLQEWSSTRAEIFEEHLNGCTSCTKRLADNAGEELALHSLADEESRQPNPLAMAWLCATLALLVLLVAVGSGRASSDPAYSGSVPTDISLDAGVVIADSGLSL